MKIGIGVFYALIVIFMIGPRPWIWLFTLDLRIKNNRARRNADLARRDADDAEARLKEWDMS